MKRFVLISERYIFAESNDEAIQKAKQICREEDQLFDNGSDVVEILEAPFGSFQTKSIYKKGQTDVIY
jgi:hypothetical protein